MQEKRQHARVACNAAVTCAFDDGIELTGIAKDISMGGMFIETDAGAEFHEQVVVTVTLPNQAALALNGVVRWKKPDGFGVQFGLLGAKQTHAIAQFLERSLSL